jgi:hypothetical protein
MSDTQPSRTTVFSAIGLLAAVTATVAAVTFAGSAQAAGPPDVNLGTAAQFAVLGSEGITRTGPIVVTGLVGSSPQGISGTGVITPSGVERGVADGVVLTAKADLLTAYGQAAGAKTPTTLLAGSIGAGQTITGGTYKEAGSLSFTRALTLDGENDPDSVFIIQVGQDFTAATGASVVLTRGAQACHVYWQIGNDAVIQTGVQFQGNILAGNDISALTGATFVGRLLTNDGAVTLDTNTITRPVCTTATTPPPGTPTATPTPTTPAPTASTPSPPRSTPTPGRGTTGTPGDDDDDFDEGQALGGPTGDSDSGTPTAAGAPSGSGAPSTGLPDTGGPSRLLAPFGAAAVLVGAGLVLATRRRRGLHAA